MSMHGSKMPMKAVTKTLSSPEEMVQFGKEVARFACSGMVLALRGDLGAGKTTFLKGFISALTGVDPLLIVSPTFHYLQAYEGCGFDIYHFDLYRVQSYEQFARAGFTDYLETGGICCFEWAERLGSHLPKGAYILELAYTGEGVRTATLLQQGETL